jgi:DNA-binding SARP family transcriptional activator
MGNANSGIFVRLLGDLSVVRNGNEVPLPPSKKVRALLAYLLVRGGDHRRERLSALLWDVADDRRAALRWALSRLRPIVDDLDRKRLISDRESVRLDATDIEVDVVTVARRMAQGPDALDLQDLQDLEGLFWGELLQGHELTDFIAYRAWLVATREELRAQYAAILHELLHRLGADPEQAMVYGKKLVELEPLNVEARTGLIRALVTLSRHSEAREQQNAAKRLFHDVGEKCPPEILTAMSSPAPAPIADQKLDLSSTGKPDVPFVEVSPPSRRRGDIAPLVGRELLFERLQEQLSDPGKGATVLLGEPGVGKSRLMLELETWVQDQGGLALFGRAHEAEVGRPYGPFLDALRRVSSPQYGGASSRRLVEDLSGHAAMEHTRDALFAGVSSFLQGRARRQRVVLFLDDLHWADHATAGLLSYVLRTCERDDLHVVITARDGELIDNAAVYRLLQLCEREGRLNRVQVPRLSPEATAELIERAAIGATNLKIDQAELFQKSAGNPLFALEIARNWGSASQSLSGVVVERLSRLPQEALALVRWASVFGSEVSMDRLRQVLSQDLDELIGVLDRLEQMAILIPTEQGYAFTHDIVRSAVYFDISAPKRRIMHHRIAQSLSDEVKRQPSAVADLAAHAVLGGDAELAAQSYLSTARHCLKIFANHQAESSARAGKHHAESLSDEVRVPLVIELLEASFAARRPDAPEALEKELELLADQALDLQKPRHARLAFTLLAYLRWEKGDWKEAKDVSLVAEQVSREQDDQERIFALAEAARCLAIVERDLGEAEALLLEAKALSERAGLDSGPLHDGLGLLRLHQGKLERPPEKESGLSNSIRVPMR